MPLLDVSDVLSDPMFAQDAGAIVLYRSTLSVGANGRGTRTTTTKVIPGVVTADTGDILDRTPDGQRIKGSITVHTTYALTDGDGNTDADEIQWNGRRYIVSAVNDYTTYGAGYVCATCDLKQVSP
ncbi:MAG: hypothetical protein B7Z41_00805 [Rhizobiales bacterium 12-66-7]|jgi:hypothetical protein|nr:MAG: hypothetical protein B7Z41_00805 [Rhizobiales bacterium 12-66-7]